MNRRKPPPPTEQALQGLAKYRDGRSADKRRDIEKAIRHLRKTNAIINVSTVARQADVQRKTVHKHPDLIAIIDQYRRQPRRDDDPAPTGRESSIVAALRRRVATQEEELRKLRTLVAEQKKTIELLYGQIESQST